MEKPFEGGLIGRAVKSGHVSFSKDIQNEPTMQHWREMAIAGNYHAAASIPFGLDNQITGILNLYSGEIDFFDDDEQNSLLNEISIDISFALKNIEEERLRRLAVDQLISTKADLEAAQMIAKIGSWSIQISTGELNWSKEVYRILNIDINTDINLDEYSHLINYVYPEDQRRVKEINQKIRRNGEPYKIEYRILTPRDGMKFIYEIGNVQKDDSGQILLLSGTVQDITELKQAEEKIKIQLAQQKVLQNIELAIIGSTDLKLTLLRILDQIADQQKVDAASILLFNPQTLTLDFAAGYGFRDKAIEMATCYLGEDSTGRAALEQRMMIIDNLRIHIRESKREALFVDEGFVRSWAVPLVIKGQLKGVLELFNRELGETSDEWQNFLEILAGQTVIAIDNNQMFYELSRSNIELRLAYDSTIEGWSRALDMRDKETEGHSRRVTDMTLKLAQIYGMTGNELIHVKRGALLHDIGKLAILDHILLKPDKLNDEEWTIMRKHPRFAYEMLSPILFLRPAIDIPYCHHEKFDGLGYPRGISGEQIPVSARIFAIVDVWDALCSERPYRQAWSANKVSEYIKSLAGTHFDPSLVDLFLKNNQPG